MTKTMEAPQSNGISRLFKALNHRVVWYTAAAALLPTLVALIILWLSQIPFDPLLWLLLLASLGAARAARRRAARRLAEERARARARRRSVPEVSANVRGLSSGSSDLWADERRSKPPPRPT